MGQPITEYMRVDLNLTDAGYIEGDYDKPKGNEFLVLSDGHGVPQAVDFLCPCGCGSECYTPVVPEGRPVKSHPAWTFSEPLTLTPSIRFTGGCKAHFNITGGKVIVHGDSGK